MEREIEHFTDAGLWVPCRSHECFFWEGGVGGRGKGIKKTFYSGRFRSVQGLTPYLLYTIFDRKGIPLVYLLLTNGTLFTYLV